MKKTNLVIGAWVVWIGSFCAVDKVEATSHDVELIFGNNGSFDYILNSYSPSDEGLGTIGENDPTLTLRFNKRYKVTVVNYIFHPLEIIAKATSSSSDTVLLSMGSPVGSFESDPDIAWIDSGNGTVTFTMTTDLFNAMNGAGRQPGYRCRPHAPFMRGNFTVSAAPLDDPIPETIEKGNISIELETVASGLAAPIDMKPAPDGTGRLFVVDQAGTIRIIQNDLLLTTPFLDISSRIYMPGYFGSMDEGDYDERGFLGIALHPGFADAQSPGYRKIYTYTSESNDATADFTTNPAPNVVDHQSVIAEWTVDSTNPNIIDISTRREIMRIDQPQFNHNGGMLTFGPDGYLYISLGDGGAADDTGDGHGISGNGQDTDTVHSSILRIDPLGPAVTDSSDPGSTNGKYRIPSDNPFVGIDGVDEIFAYGFRNPWRFSFDSVTGELIVGDVGQNKIEEIDIVTSGSNHGWNLKEGTFRFDADTGTVNDNLSDLPAGLTDPAAQYDHDEGISVTGGFVYRGSAIPELFGKYVFGDFSTAFTPADGRLFYADLDTGLIRELVIGVNDRSFDLYIKGFGQDENKELYVLAGTYYGPFNTGGLVLKIVDLCTARMPGDINKDCEVNFKDIAEIASDWLGNTLR
jgi:glucose/arabinose dehydrogenase